MIRNIKRTNRPAKERVMPASSIPAGQAFTGKISDYPDWLFLKVDNVIVSLTDNTGLWSSGNSSSLLIKNYKPVEIDIEVFEDA